MTTDELRDSFRKVYCIAKAYAKESAGYKRDYINDYSINIKSDIDEINKQYKTIEDELESIYNKVMNYILDMKLKEEEDK